MIIYHNNAYQSISLILCVGVCAFVPVYFVCVCVHVHKNFVCPFVYIYKYNISSSSLLIPNNCFSFDNFIVIIHAFQSDELQS